MHASFDRDTRRVLERARQEAQRLNHRRVGSEHLLLGLLGDRGMNELLYRLGMTQTDVGEALRAQLVRGRWPALDDPLPFAADASDALEATIEEADGFGHAWARPGHLLLGILKEPDGAGGRVLESFGATVDGMRPEVLEFLIESEEAEGAGAA